MVQVRPPHSAVASLARCRPLCPPANRSEIWASWPDLRLGRRPSPSPRTPTVPAPPAPPAQRPEGWTETGAFGGAALWSAVRNLPKVLRQQPVPGLARCQAPPPQTARGGAWQCAASWRPDSDSGPPPRSRCPRAHGTLREHLRRRTTEARPRLHQAPPLLHL